MLENRLLTKCRVAKVDVFLKNNLNLLSLSTVSLPRLWYMVEQIPNIRRFSMKTSLKYMKLIKFMISVDFSLAPL